MIHREHLKVYKRTFLSNFIYNLRGIPSINNLKFCSICFVCKELIDVGEFKEAGIRLNFR